VRVEFDDEVKGEQRWNVESMGLIRIDAPKKEVVEKDTKWTGYLTYDEFLLNYGYTEQKKKEEPRPNGSQWWM